MKINKIYFSMISLLFFLFGSSNLFAESNSGGRQIEAIIELMVALTILVVAVVLWLALVYSEKNDLEGSTLLQPLKNMIHNLTKSTPVSEESKILLDHDYDGIRELDNKIPPWFSFIFAGTILFAIAYMINYHVIGSGNVQEEEYAAEVREAALQKKMLSASGALIDEETVTFVDDPASLSEGKNIFTKNCAACHGKKGEGLVGPNLTDDYWIHGNRINDLFKTVKYGVVAKGMPTWGKQLSPTQIQEVTSYILTLHGTNPPNAKAPQGKLYEYKKPGAKTEKAGSEQEEVKKNI